MHVNVILGTVNYCYFSETNANLSYLNKHDRLLGFCLCDTVPKISVLIQNPVPHNRALNIELIFLWSGIVTFTQEFCV